MTAHRQQGAWRRMAAWGLLILFVAALGHHALPLPHHGCCEGGSCGPLTPHHGDGHCGLCLLLGCLTLFVSLFLLRRWTPWVPLRAAHMERISLPPTAQGPWMPRAPPLLLP